ncbi:unnamed protein product [Sphagnum troendelagicum]|uniref:Uncharacterized protein n=1 Tax=Sphagnum troendelagicum TaxID=128251 RepID=A0ABP0UR09_9BRYO
MARQYQEYEYVSETQVERITSENRILITKFEYRCAEEDKRYRSDSRQRLRIHAQKQDTSHRPDSKKRLRIHAQKQDNSHRSDLK